MPNKTELLELEKPLGTENYDIEVHNRNADKLDAEAGQTRASLAALNLNKATGNAATGAALNSEKVLGTDKVMTLDGTGYIDIPAGADLDDEQYRNCGVYRCTTNTTAATLQNCPTAFAFLMWVFPANGAANPTQVVRERNAGRTNQRTWYDDQGWLTEWVETAQVESGTWSPSIYGATTKGTWVPIEVDCRWTKIGTKMTLWIKFIGTLSGGAGAIQISGLPRAPKHNMGAGAVSAATAMEATAFSNGGTQFTLDVTKMGAKVDCSTINGKTITLAGNFIYEV